MVSLIVTFPAVVQWCKSSEGRKFVFNNAFYLRLYGISHIVAISHSSQYPTTGVTKAVVCVILSGMMHIKEPLLLI